jgi:hypothetical protein
LIILDSSHEYGATLRELDLWYGALAPGGLLVVHDVSRFAQSFDVTQSGGVRRAFDEWRAANPLRGDIPPQRRSTFHGPAAPVLQRRVRRWPDPQARRVTVIPTGATRSGGSPSLDPSHSDLSTSLEDDS